MELFYNNHQILISVCEAFSGWVVNLFISYQETGQNQLATFMLDQVWATYDHAVEGGLAMAKHWIDNGKP